MKARMWPWKKRRVPRVYVDLTETPESVNRKAAEARWEEVQAVVNEHRRLRAENHFGQRMDAAFHERRKRS